MLASTTPTPNVSIFANEARGLRVDPIDPFSNPLNRVSIFANEARGLRDDASGELSK